MKPNAKPGSRATAPLGAADDRMYPKGSPERKAAVAAMRRKNAARILKLPGASRRGVAKKVTDSEKVRSRSPNGVSSTGSVVSGETNRTMGGWREQLADMQWVYGHPMSEDQTQGHKICLQWLRER